MSYDIIPVNIHFYKRTKFGQQKKINSLGVNVNIKSDQRNIFSGFYTCKKVYTQ